MKLFVLLFSFLILPHLAFSQDEEVNPLQKIQNLGYKEIDARALQDEKVVKVLQDILKDSPLKKISPEELESLILSQSKGKVFHGYLERSPKLMKTIVEILQDPHALPALLGILLKKKELETFFYFWIGLIVATWAVKRFWLKKKKKWSGGKKFFISVMISFASSIVSLGAFYYLFYDEVAPVTKIAVMNWRKRNL